MLPPTSPRPRGPITSTESTPWRSGLFGCGGRRSYNRRKWMISSWKAKPSSHSEGDDRLPVSGKTFLVLPGKYQGITLLVLLNFSSDTPKNKQLGEHLSSFVFFLCVLFFFLPEKRRTKTKTTLIFQVSLWRRGDCAKFEGYREAKFPCHATHDTWVGGQWWFWTQVPGGGGKVRRETALRLL